MKILVVNATYRPKGTTSELANSFLDGAESQGAEAKMIMLCEQTVAYCTNCLKCYGFAGKGVAPCSLLDDMDGIIDRIVAGNGPVLADALRPIVDATLATVIDLNPLALSNPMWTPLCNAIIFGLIASTVISQLAPPCLYLLLTTKEAQAAA